MNSWNGTGRVTSDIERKVTQSGVSVCSFTLAVKRPRTKDETDFINFVAFRQTADYLSSYAQKGTLIEVSGVLTTRNWEDKHGNKRISYEVIVDNASILVSKNEAKPNVDINPDPSNEFEVNGVDGDLPF